jgi:methylated-DNA-[protein]-cysteine S-methyltransferase
MEVTDFEAPIGTIRFAVSDGRLAAMRPAESWEGPDATMSGRDTSGVAVVLKRYFAGEVGALDELDVEMSGTPFQVAAWQGMRKIEPGTTRSYAELADRVGAPRAVRAIGTACGRNPIGLVVPCHRVVRTDGGLGGYGWGLDRKRWLLDHEARYSGA